MSTTGSYVAAIASTRIASGGGVFHKPQTNDAGTANGTDASSPFQQMLGTSATAPPRGASDQSGQTNRGHTDSAKTDSGKTESGKKSGKDSRIDGKAGQAQQAANQIIAAAASKTLIQAGAANDDGLNDAVPSSGTAASGADSSSGTAASANPAGTGQDSDPSTQQAAADASQTLAATQIPAPDDGTQGQKPDAGNGDTLAAILESGAQNSVAAAQNVPVDATDDTSSTSTTGAIEASKSGKGKQDGKDVAADPSQTKGAAAGTTTQSDGPVSKKDHKSAKTRDQDNANAGQATPPGNPAAIVIASAAPLPTPGSADADPDSSDATAAAAIGPAKGAAKNSQVNSNPPAGAKAPAGNNQASGDASKTNSANGPSPADASSASQDGAAIQGSDASQSTDNNSAASPGDKSDNQTTPAPAQPQIQAAQPQLQPQTGVLPAVQPQQAHAGATGSVTQNIQVAQSDFNANANTVSALAVAIAAKSQSGNKQFDIRLDPPELGRVEVRLSIDATGKAQASLSADQPRTLDLLKADAPALTRALRDAGLNVSQNGLNFSLRGQDRQNGGNSFTPRSGRTAQTSLIATSTIGSVQSGANYQGPADGRLDIRV
ncbi:MAG TPA: flagellar hook-length control protein FliK [Rhizomicrobium sp.]